MIDHHHGERDANIDAVTKRIPLYISYGILLITWPAFVIVLSAHGILRRNGEWLRFLEQQVVYHFLLFMALVSLYVTSSSSPGRPDQSLAPSDARPPEEVPATPIGIDEDDVPLRALQSRKWMETRQGKARPSPLPLPSSGESDGTSISSSAVFSAMTPFPFAPSPFTPFTAAEAGSSVSSQAAGRLPELDLADEEGFVGQGRGENEGLLESTRRSTSITAKGSTGGPRWCKKCNGWKPDRCHHCRFCRQCTLKMDHHCIWVGTCVGYRNYKPFILFLTYGTLLAIYCGFEAGFECYRFFSNPNAFVTQLPPQPKSSCPPDKACPPHYSRSADQVKEEVDFAPVVYLMLALMGIFLSLSVGSLCTYHWYLTSNNLTTLENMTHAFPAALIAQADGKDKSGSPREWKPEHLLTRKERVKLREEAREINVFDLGWRRNMQGILIGERAGWWTIAVPWKRPRSANFDAGHSFPTNARALKRLRDLTTELRLAGRAAESHDSEESDEEDE